MTKGRPIFKMSRRFNEGSENAKFFEWFKNAFLNYQELGSNAIKEQYWPVYLAFQGGDANAIAQAKAVALHSISSGIAGLLGEVPAQNIVEPSGASVEASLNESGESNEDFEIEGEEYDDH